ncbi:MAG: peptide chain release factor 1 [Thermoplasmata archaeon]|nr:MAG: peptide chain release factor 1 [Thermoplasmata archaeon]
MNDDYRRYELKRLLEELGKYQGYGTNLISLYIPGNADIGDVLNQLRQEYSVAQNIKSKQVRKGVMSAIESIIGRLKYYKRAPPNGLAVFSGEVIVGPNKTDFVTYVIELPEPLNFSIYHCDSKFYIEPLKELLKEKEVYGLITLDRKEAAIGLLRGRKLDVIATFESRVPGKHRQGGQSSRRFERLIEQAAHEFFKKVADEAAKVFLNEQDLRGIFIGGPGPTKEYFVKQGYLHPNLRDKVVAVLDTGYADDYGLRELVEKISETVDELKISREKKTVNEFIATALKPSTANRVLYGYKQVLEALRNGIVGRVLVSEGLRKDVIIHRCPSCGYEELEIKEVDEPVDQRSCPSCGAPMEQRREDLVQYVGKLAEETGAEMIMISTDSDEGIMFLRTFGGLGAYLRYSY